MPPGLRVVVAASISEVRAADISIGRYTALNPIAQHHLKDAFFD